MATNLDSAERLKQLLAKLSGAKPSGSGWLACCPAHADRNASLSVSVGDSGAVLLKCYAGCTTESVLKAVGLQLRDLFPKTGHDAFALSQPKRPRGTTFANANDALQSLHTRHGKHSKHWIYHNSGGDAVGVVVRWDTQSGKDFRPIAKHPDGWRIGAMPTPRPLYNLPKVLTANTVIVCEGEKAADAAAELGFVGTTSVGGSQAAKQTDWKPLAGKDVWILPDNDEPGRGYATQVADTLLSPTPPAIVRVISLPELRDKGDLVDWIALQDGQFTQAEMRAEIEAMAHGTPPVVKTTLAAKPMAPGAKPTASDPKPTARLVPELVCMSDVPATEVQWLWNARIPLGRITTLTGRPGAGKSLTTCDIAARVSRGSAWPSDDGNAPIGDTLFISAEDDPSDTIKPRLISAGADCDRVNLLPALKLIAVDGKETSVSFDLKNIEQLR